MNLLLKNVSEYLFNFSVVFYFGYAYFVMKKLLVRCQDSF